MNVLTIVVQGAVSLIIVIVLIWIASRMKIDWNQMIDGIQTITIFNVIVTTAACVSVLVLFDVVVGTGSMMFLTNKDLQASLGISLATSGLLLSLMFIGYSLVKKKSAISLGFGVVVLIGAGTIYALDVYFDSLTADYLRFGQFVALSSLAPDVRNIQILFRGLIGGLSTVGEVLAITVMLGMPVLKGILSDALPKGHKGGQPQPQQKQHQKSTYKAKHRPLFGNKQSEPKYNFDDELTRLFHSDDE